MGLRTRYNKPDMLTWDDSYAIALALRQQHPQIDLVEVSLEMIYRWTLDLPEFFDDRELANEAILLAIYQEWLEEMIYHWTLELPEFEDDPALANDDILIAIVQEWLEEANPL